MAIYQTLHMENSVTSNRDLMLDKLRLADEIQKRHIIVPDEVRDKILCYLRQSISLFVLLFHALASILSAAL